MILVKEETTMPIVRRSKKRDAMLRLMHSTNCHPTADWIYQELRVEYPDLSLGTVYRNLNQLCEENLVCRVGVVNGQERFDAFTHPHGHFVCSGCGAVLDLPDNAPAQSYVRDLSKQYGFVVKSHEFKLRGLCKDCRGNKLTEVN